MAQSNAERQRRFRERQAREEEEFTRIDSRVFDEFMLTWRTAAGMGCSMAKACYTEDGNQLLQNVTVYMGLMIGEAQAASKQEPESCGDDHAA